MVEFIKDLWEIHDDMPPLVQFARVVRGIFWTLVFLFMLGFLGVIFIGFPVHYLPHAFGPWALYIGGMGVFALLIWASIVNSDYDHDDGVTVLDDDDEPVVCEHCGRSNGG